MGEPFGGARLCRRPAADAWSARRTVEPIKPSEWRTLLRLAFSTVALRRYGPPDAGQNSSGRSQARMGEPFGGARLCRRPAADAWSARRTVEPIKPSEWRTLLRLAFSTVALRRHGPQAQDKILLAGRKLAGASHLAERGCVGNQPRPRGQPEELSSRSSPVNDGRCCGWLSAQSRSGVTSAPGPLTRQIAVRIASDTRRRAGRVRRAGLVPQSGPDPAPRSRRHAAWSRAGGRYRIVVRSFINSSSATCTARSDSVSRALVASSSTRIGAFFKTARAMARRWRWPPESDTPFSPMMVSKPCGFWAMNSMAWACRAAATISSALAPSRPSSMLRRMVSLNRMFSWATTAIWLRKSACAHFAQIHAADLHRAAQAGRRSAAAGWPGWFCPNRSRPPARPSGRL